MVHEKSDKEFVAKLEELSEENPFACYQCGKCSAGCPFAEEMDLLPNQVVRRIQLGDKSVLDSDTIWLCASCLSCKVDCPKGIDLASVMESLREIILRENRDEVALDRIEVDGLPQIALVSSFRKKTG